MKILITGATGFTGGVLARKLVLQGYDIRVLVRDRSRLTLPRAAEVDVIEGDITDRGKLKESVRGVSKVFHIAALFRQAGVPNRLYREVNAKAPGELVRLSAEAGVERFVHCSTVGVHGHIQEPPANEEYRFAPGDIYQRTKLEGELQVMQFHHETGYPVSVVRPGPIYGPGDLRLLKLFKLASMPLPVILGNGNIYYNMVHVEDLADLFILASEKKEAVGQVFLGAGSENIFLNDIINIIARQLGRRPWKIHVPAGPFQLAGTFCEKICAPLGITPPIYRRRVDFFTKSRAFNIDKARNILGYDPRFNYEKGLAATIDWYKKHNLL